MSIITDALKKAEEERQAKPKPAVEPLLIEVESEQAELLKRFGYAKLEEASIPQAPLRIEQPNSFSPVFRNVGISLSLIVLCFLVVYLVPRWLISSNSVSSAWSNIKDSAFYDVAPAAKQETVATEVSQAPVQEPVQAEAPQETIVPIPQAAVEASAPKPEPVYVLSGTSVIGKDHYAIINGTIVEQGDKINEVTVKEILDREVVLESPSGEVKLKIS